MNIIVLISTPVQLKGEDIDLEMNKPDLLAERISLHFQEIKNRSYPLLLEKEEVKEVLKKLKGQSDSFYLLDEADDEIQGICGYYIVEKEKYLQTTIFVSLNYNEKFIKKSLDYLRETYPGYTINIGVEAENVFIIDELKNNGYWIIDDLYSATIKPNLINSQTYSDIEEIDLAQWENFKEIHQQNFGQGYWNFQRIKDNFDIWKIYSIKETNGIKSYVYVKSSSKDDSCEIFGIYGENFDYRLRLIEHALVSLKDKKLMYYFIEDEKEKEACKELGFEVHGHYQAWEFKEEGLD